MSDPKCTCGGSICGVNKSGEVSKSTYKCRCCGRRVPWCFGADDSMPRNCDDCWAKFQPATESP